MKNYHATISKIFITECICLVVFASLVSCACFCQQRRYSKYARKIFEVDGGYTFVLSDTRASGTKNTFGGYYSGYNITLSGNSSTGGDNTGMGYFSLYSISSGSFNTGYGSQVMFSDSSGNYNSAFGYKCFYANTSGSYNTANGYKALYSNSNGNFNTAFGYDALASNNTGYKNTSIGYQADVSADNLKNATALGANAIVNASNKVRIGDENVTIVESSAGSWTTSDARFKTNIKDEVVGLDFIKLLKPVVYNFDAKKFHEFVTQNYTDSLRSGDMDNSNSKISQVRQSGFLAQQVDEAAKKSGYNFNGVHAPESPTDNWSLSYEKLVVPLVKAVQELDVKTKEIDQLKTQVQQQSQQIDELKQMMQQVLKSKSINSNASYLGQSAPNPSKGNTIIPFQIAAGSHSAAIQIIETASGKVAKTIQVNVNASQTVLNANLLPSGSYMYALVVDGKQADSKQMILNK